MQSDFVKDENKNISKTIKSNFFVLLGMLLFIETTGQIIFFVKHKHFLFSDSDTNYRELVFKKHPFLAVALNKNVKAKYKEEGDIITTTEIGTRWTGADLKDPTKIRVACMGGSTTFCAMVNDETSWPAMLQKKLGDKYAVINYGFPGYSTVENIIQLSLLVPEMKPKIIIFYEGWNDIRNYHNPDSYPDYYWHGETQFHNVMNRFEDETFFEAFQSKSGFFYILNNIRERLIEKKPATTFKTPDEKIDSLFVRNLKTLKALSLTQNALPVFIPQIINPDEIRKEGASRAWTPTIDDAAFPFLMNRFDDLIKQVCDKNDSTCFVFDNMKNVIHWNKKHFADDGHFSKEGNAIFSDVLAAKIKSFNKK